MGDRVECGHVTEIITSICTETLLHHSKSSPPFQVSNPSNISVSFLVAQVFERGSGLKLRLKVL